MQDNYLIWNVRKILHHEDCIYYQKYIKIEKCGRDREKSHQGDQ